MDLYSVKLPEQLEPELEERGKRIEREILQKGNKDVEDFGEMPDDSDGKDGEEDDEKKFGTANPKSDANYELFEQ